MTAIDRVCQRSQQQMYRGFQTADQFIGWYVLSVSEVQGPISTCKMTQALLVADSSVITTDDMPSPACTLATDFTSAVSCMLLCQCVVCGVCSTAKPSAAVSTGHELRPHLGADAGGIAVERVHVLGCRVRLPLRAAAQPHG